MTLIELLLTVLQQPAMAAIKIVSIIANIRKYIAPREPFKKYGFPNSLR